MFDINDARKICRRYRSRLNRARWNSTLAKTEDASIKYIKLITEYYQALKDIGFRTTDETESGRVGRLVPITEEWKFAQLAKMSEVDRLFYEARKLVPAEGQNLIKKAIRLMAEQSEEIL